jgi:hypothetical protein
MDRRAIIQTCRTLLRPIASLLLKCGMTWREFSIISKAIFVDVASEEYGIKGRQTNISRMSILTGISRKEVRRQRELLDSAPEIDLPNKTTDATRLLSGWHQDKNFLDQNGKPRVLSLQGEASFSELCHRYGGNVPATAMLKELKRVNAVAENSTGTLTVLRRYYMPVSFDAEWILNAGTVFADLGTNINYNLQSDTEENPSRFLGRATNHAIPVEALPEFQKFLEQQGQEFLEQIDVWLTEHGSNTESDTTRLGVGLFQIQDTITG